jgi:hypothetical protein
MKTIKVYEIEEYTLDYCENTTNAIAENHFFGDINTAKAELKNIYNKMFEEEIADGEEGLPTFEEDHFIINGFYAKIIYRIVEKEIKIF